MKYAFIEPHRDEFTVKGMYRVLKVSRRGYYDWRHREPSPRAKEDDKLSEVLQRIHRQSRETYGGRRLWHALTAQGYRCRRHRVERLRKASGLEPRRRKRFKRSYEANKIAPPVRNILDR